MQFILAIASLFAGSVLAAPAPELQTRQTLYIPCSGLYGTAQCCAVNALGVADLDCENPSVTLTNGTQFKEFCATLGKAPECCVLPILEQGVLCNDPAGV